MNEPEPVERLAEVEINPADVTFNALHDRELAKKKELCSERHELAELMSKMPQKVPKRGSKAYEEYRLLQEKMGKLKEKISKKHDELMEILKTEEKTSREIQEKKS